MMTHNHGSTGNTVVWHYLDKKSGNPPKECVQDCVKTETDCTGCSKCEGKERCTGKKCKESKKSKRRKKDKFRKKKQKKFNNNNWKKDKCNKLMQVKSYGPCIDMGKLKEFEEIYKSLNVEDVILRLLDVSCGFQHGTCRAGDHVDHSDEGLSVAVTTRPGPGGLEQTVEALHARVGIGGCPASDNTFGVASQGL